MNQLSRKTQNSAKVLVKVCHVCGHVHSTPVEPQRCEGCSKSFLPLNYFNKVHAKNSSEFDNLFCNIDEIHEEDLIKGLYVIW